MTTLIEDYETIAKAISFLDEHFTDQPTLKEIADYVGLSEFHFQRLFKRWAGITPKRFVQYLTAQYAGELLRQNNSVLNTSMDVGLSSTSRLHELFVNVHAMTPKEYRNFGENLTIRYGWHDTPFGYCLIGLTNRGVCWMSFSEDTSNAQVLHREWPLANLVKSNSDTSGIIESVFYENTADNKAISIVLKGTNLQIRVWEALLKIPFGEVVSYSDIAQNIQCPNAVRAVASAIGRNPIAYIVPCHRVIRLSGALGGYEWGLTRKKAMLAWESVKSAESVNLLG